MPHSIVIFGASGDLTSRKLVPALYNLFRGGSLPADTRIIGYSRTPMTDDAWRASLRETTAKHAEGEPFDEKAWAEFAPRIHYQPGDIGSSAADEAEQLAGEDQVAGRGDRQEFGQPLDDAEDCRLDQERGVHRAILTAAPASARARREYQHGNGAGAGAARVHWFAPPARPRHRCRAFAHQETR